MSTVPALRTTEQEMAAHLTSSRAESVARRYFAVAIGICLLFYLFPFFAIRSGLKPQWTLSYWGSVVNVSYGNQRQDADIVIFGDSTAATNFDPVRMSRDLHLKVIVLPNVSTSLPVSGYDPLQRYLRANKTPRLIIFYLSGWDLDFMHNPFTQIVEEGEEMLLIHGSWPELFHYAARKPRQALMFPLHFYASTNAVGDIAYFREHTVPKLEQGHIVQLNHEVPMKSTCKFDPGRILSSAADSSVREGVREFTRPGTESVVVISPVPKCKYIDRVRRVEHPNLEIPPLQVLPAKNFREDGWQAHMLSSAIGPSTDYLEAVVRQKLAPAQPLAPPSSPACRGRLCPPISFTVEDCVTMRWRWRKLVGSHP